MIFLKHLYILLCLAACSMPPVKNEESIKKTGYDFKNPDERVVLPDTLHEISGITLIDDTTAACIQDENGIVFIYDLVGKKITNLYRFAIDGDYEGITRKGDTLYVLRSDGVLFEIAGYNKPTFKETTYNTGVPAADNEGLYYVAETNQLLIACKSRVEGANMKDKRCVYAFDLNIKRLLVKPVYMFEMKDIMAYANAHQIAVPKKGKKDVLSIKFRASAISVHPKTKELYILSAADHLLFIFNPQGKIKHIEVLDAELFNKAEGLAFLSNSDMLITNEGQDKKPTLLRFNYRK